MQDVVKFLMLAADRTSVEISQKFANPPSSRYCGTRVSCTFNMIRIPLNAPACKSHSYRYCCAGMLLAVFSLCFFVKVAIDQGNSDDKLPEPVTDDYSTDDASSESPYAGPFACLAFSFPLCVLAMVCRGFSKTCCGAEELEAYERQERERKIAAQTALREPLTAIPIADANYV